MLTLEVGGNYFDEARNLFIDLPARTIEMEHSLLSLSKWESQWKIPFLSQDKLTEEQVLDYVQHMTLTRNVDRLSLETLSPANIAKVNDYIKDPMTATTFYGGENKPGRREVITSEIIYYWMVALQIPFECQKWHINRLLTLIRVCSEKNSPPKKMSRAEAARRNRQLNAQRRKALGTTG